MTKFGFSRRAKIIRRSRRQVLRELANNSLNFFKVDVFEAQGFIDRGIQRWKPRKNNRDPGRKLNVKTGRLRNSGQITSISIYRARIAFTAPYADFVNAERQFIGDSAELDKQNEEIVLNYVDRNM